MIEAGHVLGLHSEFLNPVVVHVAFDDYFDGALAALFRVERVEDGPEAALPDALRDFEVVRDVFGFCG